MPKATTPAAVFAVRVRCRFNPSAAICREGNDRSVAPVSTRASSTSIDRTCSPGMSPAFLRFRSDRFSRSRPRNHHFAHRQISMSRLRRMAVQFHSFHSTPVIKRHASPCGGTRNPAGRLDCRPIGPTSLLAAGPSDKLAGRFWRMTCRYSAKALLSRFCMISSITSAKSLCYGRRFPFHRRSWFRSASTSED